MRRVNVLDRNLQGNGEFYLKKKKNIEFKESRKHLPENIHPTVGEV